MPVKQKVFVMAAVGHSWEWGMQGSGIFYNPFKKFYGLSLKNSDEYPPGKILKSALVNCLRGLNEEVDKGKQWDSQNIPQKVTKQIAQNEASALLPGSSRS